ncbi:hypothetical protein BH11PLA2_BH11PLA2_07920 [soil metagenome]
MRTLLNRKLIGALALGTLTLATGSYAAAPLPETTYAKVIDADTAHLNSLVELAKTKKGIPGRIKATAMLLAVYSQDNLTGKDADKMAAVRAQALKVAEAVAKKDTAATASAVAGLKGIAADAKADKKPAKLAAMHKLDLRELMDLFGASAGGGMNIEKDIRSMKKDGVKDVALAELVGARTAALADLTLELPPAFGGKKKKDDWDRWTKDMKAISVDITAEAAKGAKADMAKLKKLMGGLDGSCTNCHNVFRED